MNAPLTRFQPSGTAQCGCSAGANVAICNCSNDVVGSINVGRLTYRLLKPGQDLFSSSQGSADIHYLVDGWVALCDLISDGRRQIFQFVLPDAFLGLHADEGMVSLSALALTDVTVCSFPPTAFESLAREHPQLGVRLAWLIARDRSILFDHLTSLGRRTARERIARLLLELFLRYRARYPSLSTQAIHLPLTQEHIADATGLTGVHVNRVLSELRKEAIAEFHYRRLAIMDPDRLVKAAGVDPQQLDLTMWTKGADLCPCGKTACHIRRALAGHCNIGDR